MGKRNILKVGAVLLAVGLVVVAGCSSKSSSSKKTPADIAPTELRTVASGTSTAAAAKGTIFTCTPLTMTAASTPWASNGIIDVSKIPTVPGSVTMEPKFEITTTDTQRILVGNGVPDHPIGTFPIPPGTEAYTYYSALPAGGYANAAEIPVGPYDLQLSREMVGGSYVPPQHGRERLPKTHSIPLYPTGDKGRGFPRLQQTETLNHRHDGASLRGGFS